MQLQDIGEFNFIDSINSDVINDASTVVTGIGDDCAIYKANPEMEQLVSIDTMVEEIHFSLRYMTPYDVGYRLMTANLSDIAAMGGIPRQVVLSVAAPKALDVAILDEFYKGIKDQCKRCVAVLRLSGGGSLEMLACSSTSRQPFAPCW